MKKSIYIVLILILVTGLSCQDNQTSEQTSGDTAQSTNELEPLGKFSSAERTFLTLVEAAKQDDTRTFLNGFDFIPIFRAAGFNQQQIDTSLKELSEGTQNSDVTSAAIEFMAFLKSGNHIILNEEEAGLKTRMLLVRSEPSVFSLSTAKWYFTKRNGKWLLN
ncbi:MAG: hypothetical protein DRP35_01445, partial [Candidatus Zixiibacteriota bacterium]